MRTEVIASSASRNFRDQSRPPSFLQSMYESGKTITHLALVMGEIQMENMAIAQTLFHFKSLETSLNPQDRALYTGTHIPPTKHTILLTPGFAPPPEYLMEAAENQLLKPYDHYMKGTFFEPGLSFMRGLRQQYFDALSKTTQLKSRNLLIPFKEWLERMGNHVEFGLDSENTLQTANFQEVIERAEDLARDGSIIAIGHSAGGMLNELAAYHLLQKHERPVISTVVKIGSPEITSEILDKFDDLSKNDGFGGLVHDVAVRCMQEDPTYNPVTSTSLLDHYLHEYAAGKKDPRIEQVIYYSNSDIVVPRPDTSRAIEIGGPHVALPYRKPLLVHLSEQILAQRNTVSNRSRKAA